MVMAVFEMRNHTAAMQQGVYMMEALFPGNVRMVPLIRIVCVDVWALAGGLY